MPRATKQMKSILGAELFFKLFVGNFWDLAGSLYEITKKNFDWRVKSSTKDYLAKFEEMKVTLQKVMAKFFPDYCIN